MIRPSLAVLPLLALLTPLDAHAATRALLVGIDAYSGTPPKLSGAVNDVRDIAETLAARHISAVLLTDAAASRAAVVAAYRQELADSAPGDTLYLHFSGHGISIPDDNGDEADGRDESYLLAAFDEDRNPTEQLIDDDLDALFGEAAARSVEVIFVADACHSGSPARAVTGDTLPVRLYRPHTDPTRPAPLDPEVERAKRRDNVIAVGAVPDDRTVPEMLIDGRPRGALSFAVARSFEGLADLDGDGRITAAEFEVYTRQVVRNLAASRQTPQFDIPDARRLVAVTDGKPPASAFDARWPEVSVAITPPAAVASLSAGLTPLEGVSIAEGGRPAALQVDAAAGTVTNGLGDVVARLTDPARELPRAVRTAQLVAALNRMALIRPMDLRFSPSDEVLIAGTPMRFSLDGFSGGYLTVFDVTGNGTVQPLWPTAGDSDPWPKDRPFQIDARVSPPFGADTLVAVATAEPPEALRAALAAPGGPSPETLETALAATLRSMPAEIGLQAFFTRGE